MVYQWCSRLVRLKRCWTGVQALGQWIFPKESLKWDGNQMEVGGGGCSDTCKAREDQHKYQTVSRFGGNSP